MTNEQTPRDMMTFESTCEIRQAISVRRESLISSAVLAIVAGRLDNEYGAGFWSKRIQQLNDAAVEFGIKG